MAATHFLVLPTTDEVFRWRVIETKPIRSSARAGRNGTGDSRIRGGECFFYS
jgi:hypothetical protein